jgi:sugar phosphate isomerase/epimerase
MMIGVSCPRFGISEPEEIMDIVSKEFGHWEIFSEHMHDITCFSSRFSEMKRQYGMNYSIHAPICDINIASINERMREASVEETIRTMEHANRMDIRTITIHPGIYATGMDNVKDLSINHSKVSLKRIEKASKEYGLTAAIENMPALYIMMGQTPEELSELIDGTDLAVCFDIGHANTRGKIDEFIDTFGERIANIHIHDNMGKNDDHMTIGDGVIDFPHVLSKLRWYKGNYIIESRDIGSAVESKKRLESMLR